MGGISSTVTMDYQKRVSPSLYFRSIEEFIFQQLHRFVSFTKYFHLRLFSKEGDFFFYSCYGKLSLYISYNFFCFFSLNFFPSDSVIFSER